MVHPGVGALRGGPVSSGPDRQPGLEGIGGALLTPGSLAIIQATFIPADRGRAIGAWSGLGGVFGAIGPLLGGFLVQAVSWRLVFVINLPLGVAAMAATRHIPETAPHQVTGRLDVSGPTLAVLGLGGVTYGLIQGAADGWTSPPILLSLILGAGLLVGFLFNEARHPSPVLLTRPPGTGPRDMRVPPRPSWPGGTHEGQKAHAGADRPEAAGG
ncbi:MAG: MFS transporter, partial [Candidatus Dormiibacterota bacterium]